MIDTKPVISLDSLPEIPEELGNIIGSAITAYGKLCIEEFLAKEDRIDTDWPVAWSVWNDKTGQILLAHHDRTYCEKYINLSTTKVSLKPLYL